MLTSWPRSLLDWDILFLVPLPWWGPVLAPIISTPDGYWRGAPRLPVQTGRYLFRWKAWSVNLVGVAVALYVFMEDAIPVAGRGTQALRELLPTEFNWPLFITALTLMSVPVVKLVRRLSWRSAVDHPTLDYSKWIAHFAQNRERRAEPDWTVPVKIRSEVVAPQPARSNNSSLTAAAKPRYRGRRGTVSQSDRGDAHHRGPVVRRRTGTLPPSARLPWNAGTAHITSHRLHRLLPMPSRAGSKI